MSNGPLIPRTSPLNLWFFLLSSIIRALFIRTQPLDLIWSPEAQFVDLGQSLGAKSLGSVHCLGPQSLMSPFLSYLLSPLEPV